MKLILKIIGGLLLLLVITMVGLTLWFTDERLRTFVVPQVSETLGRDVEIDHLSLSLFRSFPNAGLQVEGFRIAGRGEENPATFEQANVTLSLLPLFRRELEITHFSVDRPTVHFIVYNDSTTNFDDLFDTAELEEEETAGFQLTIPDISVREGRVIWHNNPSDSRLTLEGIDATLGLEYGELLESTAEITMQSFHWREGDTEIPGDFQVSLRQVSVIDMNREELTLHEGALSLRGLELDLNGSLADWSSGEPLVDLEFSSASEDFGDLLRLAPPSFEEHLAGLQSSGSLHLSGFISGRIAEGEIPDFRITMEVDNGSLSNPDLEDPIEEIRLRLLATPELVQLGEFSATVSGNLIEGSGALQNPFEEDALFEGTLRGDLELASLMHLIPAGETEIEHLSGLLSLNGVASGSLAAPEEAEFEADMTLRGGALQLSEMPDRAEEIELNAQFTARQVDITQGGLRIGENRLALVGTIDNYLEEEPLLNLRVNGSASLEEISRWYSLEPWIQELTGSARMDLRAEGPAGDPLSLALNGSLELSDVSARGDSLPQPVTNLRGVLQVAPTELRLEQFFMDFGSSDFELSGTLRNWLSLMKEAPADEETPLLAGQWVSHHLNMDELMDWEESDEEIAYPIELPNIQAQVTSRIDTLTIFGIAITNIEGSGSMNREQILLEDASGHLFGGTATGRLLWSVPEPDRSSIHFTGEVSSLQADEFFREFPLLGESSRMEQYASGAFSAGIDWYSEMDVFLNNLPETIRADGSFGMGEARLTDHPLQVQFAEWLGSDELRNLGLDEWTADIRIEDSLLELSGVRITSSQIGIEMNGTQHLLTDEIDFTASIRLPGHFGSSLGNILPSQAVNALTTDDGFFVVPVGIDGTMEAPRISPQQEMIENIIQEYIRDTGRNLIRDLFGN
ncbi:MAG: AsmA-like C-terminal region-containing protein [Balneolaceae bacterium]